MEDMRQLVRTWSDAPVAAQRESGVRSNILNKGTRTRLADVYQRAFLPRFVSGPIPKAWKLVRPLEDVGAPIHIVRPVYYWISAKASLSLVISVVSLSCPGMRVFTAASARKTC